MASRPAGARLDCRQIDGRHEKERAREKSIVINRAVLLSAARAAAGRRTRGLCAVPTCYKYSLNAQPSHRFRTIRKVSRSPAVLRKPEKRKTLPVNESWYDVVLLSSLRSCSWCVLT